MRRVGWTLLLSLLAVTLVGALIYDRTDWPGLLPGEATVLMQADSLARDFDLSYTRVDYDRLLLTWGADPADLELTSAGGRRITFDRPFPHALWLAPFARLWPRRGFAVANALALILAALTAAWALERRVGAAASLWVVALVFASVSFGYVFLATDGLFLLATMVGGWSLVVSLRPVPEALHREHLRTLGRGKDLIYRGAEPSPASVTGRALVAGALLAMPLVSEPLCGPLALAALFALPRRQAARGVFVLGLAIGVALQLGVSTLAGSAWPLLAEGRFRFTPATGFPLVDFPAEDWTHTVRRLRALHWQGAPRLAWGLDGLLALWNLLYLFVGRNLGLLPYFPPLILVAAWATLDGYRKALLVAAGLWLIGLLTLQPFHLNGVEGMIGNPLFLPVYGALWFLAGRPLKARSAAVWALVATALAAPFMVRLWTSPWRYPPGDGRGYAHITAAALAVLPFETSQRHVPAGELVEHGGLWIRLLDDGAWAETGRDRLVLDGDAGTELLIISPFALDVVRLEFGSEAPSGLELDGAAVGETILLAEGGIAFRILPRGLVRRHPMWWTPERQWVYRLRLRFPEAGDETLPFRLTGERVETP